MMNLKKLTRHFPEIAHLSPDEQQQILTRAYLDAFSSDNKMRNWRSNLVSALVMTSLCFIFVLIIRPAVGMSQQTSAILLMLIAFPAYLLLQQRRMIRQIRTSLQKFLP